ncbi:MAG: hypothetical protein ABSF23_08750 [Terracidiphilus sp.]|jgi:hypothetical protein
MTISGQPSKTDWEWVKKQIAEDAPIPYDPNDDEAVDRFLTEANRVRPGAKTSEPPISKAS